MIRELQSVALDTSHDTISCLKQGSPGEIGAHGQQGNTGILV